MEGEGVVVIKLVLYYDATTEPLGSPTNAGFDEALKLAQMLQKRGAPIQLVNTRHLGGGGLQKAYLDAVGASVLKKYRIRQVFGSRRHSGWLFGKDVPALLVYDRSDRLPDDVYPHEALGRTVTIKEFLDSVKGELEVKQ